MSMFMDKIVAGSWIKTQYQIVIIWIFTNFYLLKFIRNEIIFNKLYKKTIKTADT